MTNSHLSRLLEYPDYRSASSKLGPTAGLDLQYNTTKPLSLLAVRYLTLKHVAAPTQVLENRIYPAR